MKGNHFGRWIAWVAALALTALACAGIVWSEDTLKIYLVAPLPNCVSSFNSSIMLPVTSFMCTAFPTMLLYKQNS